MKLLSGYDPRSVEALKYEELAVELVQPERFASPAMKAAVVLHLPLPEIVRIYGDNPPDLVA